METDLFFVYLLWIQVRKHPSHQKCTAYQADAKIHELQHRGLFAHEPIQYQEKQA